MSTIISSGFAINGVISTDKTVLQNINTLCTAVGAWMTYDISEGEWAVVINRAGSSVASFDDDNIIGNISISGTGVNELYNEVTIEFPHKDLRDQTDYIDYSIASEDRFPNELPNKMFIRIDCINNPVQAQYIAVSELKQSRVDKVIQFRTDYSKIGLKAGDLISVTNTPYGYTNKVFRIIKLEEDDSDALVISITALEYDANVYDTTGLVHNAREKKTGIVPKSANTALTALDNQASLKLDLTDGAKALGLNLFFVPGAGAQGFNAGTYYLDSAGQKVSIAADDVVITWTFLDGQDLDIRARLVSPDVGQNTVDKMLGFTDRGEGNQYVWPPGGTTGSSGTAYIEWGGDNQGLAGNSSAYESVRIDIDRLKAAFPSKRYFALECRGNWFVARGSKPVQLVAVLYQGGTTTRQEIPLDSGNPPFGFTNVGATRSRELSGVQVYVDSFHGDSVESDGFDGATAPGDIMGYFVFDTQTNEGQFLQQLPPQISQ